MGWTSTYARFYTESGKVDRKAECDHLYTWEDEKTKTEVLKSAMKGAIYYAAVRTIDKASGNFEVWAAVCITSTRNDGGFNFGYKSMSEDCGPFYCDCPKSILVLLTDTNSEYAKEWREECWANIRTPKKSLASVKIGEIIEFELGGETIRAEKMAPAHQFKTPWFKIVGEFEYISKTRIKDWRIVLDGAATPAETPQIPTETTEAANVSAEGEKESERTENNRNQVCYSHHGRVLHNCDLKTWDKFRRKHKDAIIVFHYGATYTVLQKEAVKVSVLCGASYTVNRYGVEVCQFDDAALMRIIGHGVYVAIVELTKEPEYGLPQPPKSAPQSTQNTPAANYATPRLGRAQRANKQPHAAFRKFRTARPTILRASAKCPPANPPPIGSP